MISSVELANFVSHSDTKLELGSGVTVFVGDNGAGKSSVIDAITFALFGRHTRKSNTGLIKRGSTSGFARVDIMIRGKQYRAERKIDSRGGMAALLSENRSGTWSQIAAGERRQFGESMTEQIEEKIGLDFEKLKIASIVTQGELDSIIRASPKKFKELLNSIIGIDRLDAASESMRDAKYMFRQHAREAVGRGHDDTNIESLQKEADNAARDLEESRPRLDRLMLQKKDVGEEITRITADMEAEAPKHEKAGQLRAHKQELVRYAGKAVRELRDRIEEKEKKIQDCEKCIGPAAQADALESELAASEESVRVVVQESKDLASQRASLREKMDLADKLRLKDGRCPVCNSRVDSLNQLFQKEHLLEEIAGIEGKMESCRKENEVRESRRRDLSARLRRSREAQATLQAHSIGTGDDLDRIRRELKADTESLPASTHTPPADATAADLAALARIDSHTRSVFESVSRLEQELIGFDESRFSKLRVARDEKQERASQIDREIGATEQQIRQAGSTVRETADIVSDLRQVGGYMEEMDMIRSKIFGRDGPVATSLRSWALSTISVKASEYLALMDTKISSIRLAEKTRNVSIECLSKAEVLDLESLSGGERVAVAIALRLGMASLLGASNLNLMILDEPTTHLDSEKRKSLVRVISGLSEAMASAENRMQFIIISHDAEIFEDADIEKVYKFKSGPDGTSEVEEV